MLPEGDPLIRRHRRARARRFIRNLTCAPLAVAIAGVGVMNGTRGILDPGFAPVHLIEHAWLEYVWAVIYLAGGLCLMAGIGSRYLNLEVGGALFFAAGAIVNAIAYALFLDFTRTTGIPTVATLLWFAAWSLVRAWRGLQAHRSLTPL